MDLEAGEAELFEVRHEGLAAGKAPVCARQKGDGGLRQPMIAHVIERGLVDDVIVPAGPQKFQEIQPGLRTPGSKPGEAIVADMGTKTVLGLMPGTRIVNRDPGRRGKATKRGMVTCPWVAGCPLWQRRHHRLARRRSRRYKTVHGLITMS